MEISLYSIPVSFLKISTLFNICVSWHVNYLLFCLHNMAMNSIVQSTGARNTSSASVGKHAVDVYGLMNAFAFQARMLMFVNDKYDFVAINTYKGTGYVLKTLNIIFFYSCFSNEFHRHSLFMTHRQAQASSQI